MFGRLLLNPNILTRLFWFWGWLKEKLLNWFENVELAVEFELFWIGFGVNAGKEDAGGSVFVWAWAGEVEAGGEGISEDEDAWDVDVELLA